MTVLSKNQCTMSPIALFTMWLWDSSHREWSQYSTPWIWVDLWLQRSGALQFPSLVIKSTRGSSEFSWGICSWTIATTLQGSHGEAHVERNWPAASTRGHGSQPPWKWVPQPHHAAMMWSRDELPRPGPAKFQIHEQNECCYFRPLHFGIVYFTEIDYWNIPQPNGLP